MKYLFLLCMLLTISTTVYSAETSANHLTSDALKNDLIQLYADLKSSHINLYHNVSEEEYETYYKSLLNSLDTPMTKLEAKLTFQRFVAFGKVAHANINVLKDDYQQYRDNGGVAFPIYVKIDQPKWFVDENYSNHVLPEGAEITHINNKPVTEWLDLFDTYISADTTAITASLLEFQLPQYLWLDATVNGTKNEQFKLTIKQSNNAETINIAALSRDELQNNIDAKSNPKENESALREYKLLDDRIAYLKPGPFYNAENPADVWNTETFTAFIDEAFEYFIDNKATKLIIDVRNNPGGTNSFSDSVINWFADKPFRFASEFIVRSSEHAKVSNEKRLETSSDSKVSQLLAKSYQDNPFGAVFSFNLEDAQPRSGKQYKGEVFVLIDRSSYSNAVSLAAIVKDYGFGKVIGESTTDFATTMGAMESFTLKNSGIEVGFPKALIIRPSGDRTPGPVHPDVAIDEFELDAIIELPMFQ